MLWVPECAGQVGRSHSRPLFHCSIVWAAVSQVPPWLPCLTPVLPLGLSWNVTFSLKPPLTTLTLQLTAPSIPFDTHTDILGITFSFVQSTYHLLTILSHLHIYNLYYLLSIYPLLECKHLLRAENLTYFVHWRVPCTQNPPWPAENCSFHSKVRNRSLAKVRIRERWTGMWREKRKNEIIDLEQGCSECAWDM